MTLRARCVCSAVLEQAGCTQAARTALDAAGETRDDAVSPAALGAPGAHRHLLRPCLMHHLDNNTLGERDLWPWKVHTHYYRTMQYS